MAIDLLHHFTNKISETTTVNNNKVQLSEAELSKILRQVYALKPGDSLEAKLLSSQNGELKLLLGDMVNLTAKMDKNLLLQPGQMMNFIVNSNQKGKLTLQPLFTNTGLEQNAMKALEAANIPVTEQSMKLASEMMKQGLPINKDSLQMMFRHFNLYSEADLQDLVMLQKMNIPINQTNVNMMHLYHTNQHALFGDLKEFSNQLTQFVLNMNQKNPEEVQFFLKEFTQVFNSKLEAELNLSDTNKQILFNSEQNTTAQNKESNSVLSEQSFLKDVLSDADLLNKSVLLKEGEKISASSHEINHIGSNQLILNQKLLEEIDNLLLNKMDIREFKKDSLNECFFKLLKENFLMKPEEVLEHKNVKNFYENLNRQLDVLENFLNRMGKGQDSLTKNVQNIKSNIQFMNQINELYHYVQLPLKMNQQAASGDLYVYKKKHAKSGDDGRLTALLHLSMPTLGNMDVFLSLEKEKLSTRFCMEKEELIDFMEDNMDCLNDRLIKKGYHIQTLVTAMEKEEESVIDHIMKNEARIPLSTDTSFDARC